MLQEQLTSWVVSCLLLGLRIAPVFTFAPPFSLVRIPRLFFLLFGLGVSVCLVAAYPQQSRLVDMSAYGIFIAAMRELALGGMFVLAFQIVFGALYLAGRVIDIQAGFGFALLVNPSSQEQVPLVGTLFAYAAGAAFFSFNGHIELLRLLGASLDAIPLSGWSFPTSIGPVTAFTSMVFLVALGVGGSSILTLFLVDIMITLLSRTVPQMNVLVLGFQVKTITLLVVLPISFGLTGALFLRLMAFTLQSLPGLI